MGRAVEVEWQFDVRDVDAFARWLARQAVPRWSVTEAGVRRHADVYFDTDTWGFARAGWALRVRRHGPRAEATLKQLARARRGVARRRELTAVVRSARPGTLAASAGPVGSRIRAVAGGEPLRRLFGVRTRRQTFLLRRDGRVVAEIALDRTRIVVRGRRVRRLERVEIEVTAGPSAQIARFVATLRRRRHLTIATRSKFEEGLRAARLAPPARH